LRGHVLLAEEIAGGVGAGDGVERHQSRAAVARTERLVEANVAVAADAQSMQVDAAGPFDRRFVLAAVSVDVRPAAIVPSGMWMFSSGTFT
jgi:hypothetical protein